MKNIDEYSYAVDINKYSDSHNESQVSKYPNKQYYHNLNIKNEDAYYLRLAWDGRLDKMTRDKGPIYEKSLYHEEDRIDKWEDYYGMDLDKSLFAKNRGIDNEMFEIKWNQFTKNVVPKEKKALPSYYNDRYESVQKLAHNGGQLANFSKFLF